MRDDPAPFPTALIRIGREFWHWEDWLEPHRNESEETDQLCFRLSNQETEMRNPTIQILHASAGHARQILDEAIKAAEAAPSDADGKIDLMLALVRRAHLLLATLEQMPEGAFIPARFPSQEVG